DSPYGAIGFIDITDPKTPKAGGILQVDGEPTSVAVAGSRVFAGVNTSESYTSPSGRLDIIDIASRKIENSCDLGGQPDSVAVSDDQKYLAVAIENERDEDLNNGELPQLPAGYLTIFNMQNGQIDCATMKKVDLTGIAEIGTDDPEPEFVSFNTLNQIAVTLEENNHIAMMEGGTGEMISRFSAGHVDLDEIDTKREGQMTFESGLITGARESETIRWVDNGRVLSANGR